MTLNKKTAVISAIVIISFEIGCTLLAIFIASATARDFAFEQASQAFASIWKTFDFEKSQLATTASKLSQNSDFINLLEKPRAVPDNKKKKGKTKEIEPTTTFATFDLKRDGIDYLIVLGTDDNRYFDVQQDDSSAAETLFTLPEHFFETDRNYETALRKGLTGILEAQSALYNAASFSIFTSQGNKTIVLLKKLDQSRFDFGATIFSGKVVFEKVPTDSLFLALLTSTAQNPLCRYDTAKNIVSSALVRDLNTKPVSVLTFTSKTTTYKTAKSAVILLLLALVIFGAILFCVTTVLVNKLFTKRVRKIFAIVSQFEERSKTEHITDDTDDEITNLENALHTALRRIDLENSLGEQLRQTLEYNEMRMRAVVSALPDMIFHLDEKGVINDFSGNRSKLALFYRPSEMLGKTFTQLGFHVDFTSQLDYGIRFALDNETMHSFEHCFTINGEERFFECRIVPVRAHEVIAVVRDISQTRIAQKMLAAQKKYFEKLFEDANVWVEVVDCSCNTILWNKKAEEISGYSKEQVLNNKDRWSLLYHDERYRESLIKHCREVFEERKTIRDVQTVCTVASGTQRVINWSSNPIFDESGEITGAMFIGEDITQKIAVQSALLRSEEKYRALAESARDFIYVLDENGKLLYVNNCAARFFSMLPEELVGKAQEDIFTPELTEIHRKAVAKVLETGEKYSCEEKITVFDNAFWIDVALTPLRDEHGIITSVLGISRDITARKITEQKVAFQAKLLNTVAQAVMVLDNEGKITYWNKAAEEIFKFSEVEVLKVSAYDLLVEPELREDLQSIIEAAFEGHTWSNEFEMMDKHGRSFPVIAHTSPVLNSEGIITGAVLIAHEISDRVAVERALAERKNFIAKITDTAPSIIYVYDIDEKRNVFVNKAFFDLLGHEPELTMQMNARFFDENQHPDDAPKLASALMAYRNASDTDIIEREGRLRHANGNWVCLRMREVVFLRNKNGEPKQILGIAQDITKLKQEQLRVSATETKFSWIFSHSPVGIAVFNENGTMATYNRKFDEIFGLTHNEPTSFNLFNEPNCKNLFAEDFSNIENFAGEYEFDFDLVRKNESFGTKRTGKTFLQVFASVFTSPEGDKKYLFQVADISEHKSSELQLAESEFKLRALLHNSSDVHTVITAEGTIAFVSDSVSKTLGYTPEEVLGKTFFDFIHPEDLQLVESDFQNEIMKKESRPILEFRLRKKNGIYAHVQAVGTNMSTAEKIGGLAVNIRDITQDVLERLHKAEIAQRLQYSQKMEAIGLLAGGIAHDFNNLLQAITGFTDLAISRVPHDTEVHDDLNTVLQAATRAAALVDQLLTFGRRDAFHIEQFAINDVVAEMRGMFVSLCGERITVETALNAKISEIAGDRAQIKQVLLNLCLHAKDALDQKFEQTEFFESAKVRIETSRLFIDDKFAKNFANMIPGEYVRVIISHNGVGFSDSELDRIFDPFYASFSFKTHGLILANVYAIVDRHKGFITVASDENIDTKFKIYLPALLAREEDAYETNNAVQKISDPRNCLILLLEDEFLVRKFTEKVLKNEGFEVIVAETGKQALELAERYGDLVSVFILDVVLPDISGVEVYRRIAEKRNDARVIFCSAHSFDDFDNEHFNMKFIRSIPKPFNSNTLVSSIFDLLNL